MGKLKLFTGCQPLLEILFAFWYASYSCVSRIFSSHRHEQDLSSQRSSVAHIVAIIYSIYYYITFSLLCNACKFSPRANSGFFRKTILGRKNLIKIDSEPRFRQKIEIFEKTIFWVRGLYMELEDTICSYIPYLIAPT